VNATSSKLRHIPPERLSGCALIELAGIIFRQHREGAVACPGTGRKKNTIRNDDDIPSNPAAPTATQHFSGSKEA